MAAGQQYRISSRDRKKAYLLSVPSSDIEKCISFNVLSLVVSLISLLLAISDIPRSGTGILKLDGWLNKVLPDTAVFFGPFTFHTAQILRLPTVNTSGFDAVGQLEYHGHVDGVSINSTALWSYKFDSMSVPQRALAKALNVTAYPPCTLYKKKCSSDQVSLKDTFLMLDGLIDAIHHAYFPKIQVGQVVLPIGFRTISYWVDRFHHYFLTFFGHRRSETRLHAVYFYRMAPSQILNVCDRNIRKSHRPFFCDIPIKWTCPAPEGGDIKRSSSDRISLALHLMVRLAQMQRQYPHLHFDVTVFASQMLSSNHDRRLPVATSLLVVQKNGITTIIRGRSCPDLTPSRNPEDCKTVLVDDHRYEREFLTTDITQWYWITSFARETSQCYIWARIALLWYGCYRARSSEPKFQTTTVLNRIWCACVTSSRIPSHVIIYSSWMPAIGYAFAYFIDCNIHHQHIDEVFSAVNGTFIFDFWKFLRLSFVQMRNVWFIALCFRCLTLMEVNGLASRADPWKLRHGLRSFNGQLIGWISALTIFTPMRRLEFRTTDVIFFEILPTNLILKLNSLSTVSDLNVEFGFRLDLQSICQSCILLFLAVLMIKLWYRAYVWLLSPKGIATQRKTISGRSFVYCHSRYLPFSLRTIASCASMSLYWDTTLINPHRKPSALRKLISIINTMPWLLRSQRKISTGLPLQQGNISAVGPKVVDVVLAHMLRRSQHKVAIPAVLPTRTDENPPINPYERRIYKVELRTKAIRSMVRLINLALFTDPITWLKLYFIGCPLYLYRVTSVQTGGTTVQDECIMDKGVSKAGCLFLLPCTLNQLLENSLTSNEYDQGNTHYELVDTVESTDIPWDLLLQCG